MKKLTSVLLITFLLFSLCACGAADLGDDQVRIPQYSAHMCKNGYVDNDGYWDYALNLNSKDLAMPIYKMETTQELSDFKKNLEPYFYLGENPKNPDVFSSVTADCDDAFFANNALIVVYVYSGSISYRYEVQSVEIRKDSLTVVIELINNNGAGLTAADGHLAIIRIPKNELIGVTSYTAQMSKD